jgi:hypothetical protein
MVNGNYMYGHFSSTVSWSWAAFWSTYLGICRLLKLQELYELWELLLKFKLKPMGSKEMEYKIGQLFSQIFKYFWVISM